MGTDKNPPEKKLSGNFRTSSNPQAVPVEQDVVDTAIAKATTPETPKDAFAAATETVELGLDGTYTNSKGKKVHGAMPQMEIGDAFRQLFFMLSMLFQDPEGFSIMFDMFYPEDVYTDPSERGLLRNRLHEVAVNPDHPDRNLNGKEFVAKHFPKFDELTPAYNKLFTKIIEKESSGHDSIVYDYTGSKGFMPGDRTPGGLDVPDFTTMTVNQVLNWQKQYLDEQTRAGLGKLERSSATGITQFTYTTLKEMRDNNIISGDAIFDADAQVKLGIARLYQARGLQDFYDGKITVAQMIHNTGNEWAGAKNISAAELKEIFEELKAENAAGMHNVADLKPSDRAPIV